MNRTEDTIAKATDKAQVREAGRLAACGLLNTLWQAEHKH
jgi:hypothetical protein